MDSGSDIKLTVGSTEVSQHVALEDHAQGDLSIKALAYEPNYFQRQVKEALMIQRKRPTLINRNAGKYTLPHIYGNIVKESAGDKVEPPRSENQSSQAENAENKQKDEMNVQRNINFRATQKDQQNISWPA